MKTIRSLLLVPLLSGTLGLGLVGNVQAQEECSVATLQGDYLVTGAAEARVDQRDDPTYPRRVMAVWNFDGQGNMSAFNTVSLGGEIRRDSVNATYTVDSDRCTATLTFEGGGHFDLFITRDGSEGAAIRVDDGFIATRSIKKR